MNSRLPISAPWFLTRQRHTSFKQSASSSELRRLSPIWSPNRNKDSHFTTAEFLEPLKQRSISIKFGEAWPRIAP
jgi:hypothetical protein